ncbi:IclR family transcriptional regulator [Halomicrobium salinisoli]|uniref:IclR family transcriptional regulator n=1 Tax=Halomicrobium salinisoli TaxID=2878391 RepID=UPI001CEFF897|nr:IclR family transcriptional regulator [Halomicrobium salinisoli]
MTENAYRVSTTETSFRIVEAIRDDPGVGVSQLARDLDLSKGAVHKHLRTLADLGYLVREDDGYYLGNRFLSLGVRARKRLPLEAVRPVVRDLTDTTGHVANFIAHENDRGVYTLRIEPTEDAATGIVEGDVAPLHATAGGKAILAFLPDEERSDVLDGSGLAAYTDKTITDRRELERELRSVRDRRVAFDREEFREGYQCVASPVIGRDGDPVGAVSVTGSDYHMSGKRLEEDVTGLVTSAAKSIENDLLSQ